MPIFLATTLASSASEPADNEKKQKAYPEKSLKIVYKDETTFSNARPYLYHIPNNCFGLSPEIISKKSTDDGQVEVLVKYHWNYSNSDWRKYVRFYKNYTGIKTIEVQ